ncbi:uncharacterized protein LOC115884897 [Sitophilus oryzae]|uniref:Uncharacterized protein LOC115884897 n=1 Tax=Sitophilus oryzae TaxID=7048 RepID=A0A6J2Y782_SITOR|nr:uncharacterized protein LOC115884897 [Sitophilus oryzae]
MNENVFSGYLEVKISSKSRRGFTPWRAWQKQWCEIRRLDDIEAGIELKLKSSEEGGVLSCLQVPRSATLCRTDSKTKQFAFGVFNLLKTKKPLIFLAGSNETDSQEWMICIRRMLSIASYIPVGENSFRVSLVDNAHSRNAGMLGLYGVLNSNSQEIIINDPCTGRLKAGWRWYHFHQFHLQATCEQKDDKKIIVMHTSREFSAGPGQLYVYCPEGPKLLRYLISRGQNTRFSSGLQSKRFSRSEGDLCINRNSGVPDSPLCFRSQTGSDDSGVPSSEDTEVLKSQTESNLVQLGMGIVTKTPGGSETEDSYPDLREQQETVKLPRNESGISLASGIYEEIPDEPPNTQPTVKKDLDNHHLCHVYENPLEMIFDRRFAKFFKPPPLPPRTFDSMTLNRRRQESAMSPVKQRCNTLPARDLSKMSQLFGGRSGDRDSPESEYVVMSPGKPRQESPENIYIPMGGPETTVIKENVYVMMTGTKEP